ncbi:MAG: FtsX-like permease family protein [Acidobacteria bacterium]|nr:FtsX-like permease family protein [Acidobacteriota bacterium]
MAKSRSTLGVVIINESLARRFFRDRDSLGKRISFGTARNNQPVWLEIVGVVKDIRHEALENEPVSEAYVPYTQAPYRFMSVVVRTRTDPESMMAAVQNEVRVLDPQQPVFNLKTMEQVIAEATAGRRLNVLVLGILASLALALAAVGIYGVLVYLVTQRSREIGIRMALGAQQIDVLKLVVRQGMAMALIGVAIGLIGAFALTRLMKELLYDVSATDPMTFVVIAMLLTLVSLLACWIPARRSVKVDPMIALRCE